MFSCNSYIVSSNELYVYVYVYVDVLMLLVDAYVYVYVHVQGIVSEGCKRIRCSTTTRTLLRFYVSACNFVVFRRGKLRMSAFESKT